MKQPKRILAYSALALIVMLAAFGAIAFDTSNVALAQGTVPAAPTLTATASGATTINLAWNTVDEANTYELWAWDDVNEWQELGAGTLTSTSTSYSHTGLTSGKTYYYQIRAVNESGVAGAWSTRINEVAGDAPARPVLTATAGYLQITVSWPQVATATSYEIWAWDGTWTQLMNNGAAITGTSHTHTGLTAGRTYYYQGRAVNSGGTMSAWSAQVSATVLSSPNISMPNSFSAARGDQQLTLSWSAPTSLAGLTIARYDYRQQESGGAWGNWTNAGNDGTETITGLTNGTTYNFELRAVSTTGAEGETASTSGTPSTVPDAPVLMATEGYRLVMLSWDAPENNGAAITSYHIEMLNTQNNWVPETTVPGSATSYTDRSLNDSTVYTYRIIAENVAGRSSASNSADATTLAQPPQVPGPPAGITAAAGAGKVTLTVTPPLFNGGSPIIRYEYRYRLASATSYSMSFRSAMLELMFDVEPLTPGTEYHFEVRAVNSVGAGEAIDTDDITDAALRTPTATGPTAAPRMRAPAVGSHAGTVAGHESNATITLSWDTVPVANNGGDAITTYELCYKTSTESTWTRWPPGTTGFSTPAVSGGGALWSATHGADGLNLEPGTTYQYRARGVNTVAPAGDDTTCTHDGPWSSVVSATTPVVAPAAPTLLVDIDETTTPNTVNWDLNVNSITIRWTAPADNGGAAITGYEVWVGTATVTAQADIDALSPTVTNLPPSRTEFISIGLSATTEYFYRVRARNGSGNSRVGAWSLEQAGMTTASQAGTPDAPTIGSPTVADATGNVTVPWTAPGNNGASPILGYEVAYQRVDDNTPADSVDDDEWATSMRTSATAVNWVHMSAPGGTSWVYRVRAVNGSGAGAWSDNTAATAVAARAPDAPMLTATAEGPDEIMLQWTIPESNGTDITGFSIQQWDNADPGAWGTDNLLGPASAVGAVTNNTPELTVFAVTGLDAGTTYYFRIQTLGTPVGTWSTPDATPASNAGAASAMTDAGVPGMPVITATPGEAANPDSIMIAWPTAPSSGGSDITGYELRVWDGSKWMPLATPAADDASYTHDDLNRGERYYYTLAARNTSGLGPWSDAASAMTTAGNPEAPMLTAVATGATSVQLSWTVPDSNGATITEYQIQRSDPAADPAAWDTTAGNLLATGDTVTRFEDTGLAAGTMYYYRIRAMPQPDADTGWSATNVSDGVSVTTHGDTPGRPAWDTGDFTATANSLVLAWDEPTVTGGSAITGYEVRIWSGSSWVVEATLGNVDTYTDMNLDAGTKYYYIVRAINSQGAGLWSAFKSGTTTAANPDAPVLTATATGLTTVRLTWTVPDDNGTPITGYTLQRWDPDAGPPAAWGTDNLLGTGDTNITLFVDSGRMAGTTYYYRIQATVSGGTGAWSTIQSAMTHSGRPGRPMNLNATADGQNAIDLTWTAAEANGSPIVRYELQRWDVGSSMWVTVRNDLPSTRTSYKDANLMAGTRYSYRLRAINRAADNNGVGRWSTLTSTITAE